MLAKLGLTDTSADNIALIKSLLELMTQTRVDHTLTFRRLAEQAGPALPAEQSVAPFFELPPAFDAWLAQWQARLATENSDASQQQQRMLATNPVFIPRNHLVEEAIRAAVTNNDFQPFHQLVDVLAEPFRYDMKFFRYALPPGQKRL